MEDLVMLHLFKDVYKGKKVLVTGHTGFKGSWLSLWLDKLGAEVIGYALKPESSPSHFDLLDSNIDSFMGNLLDKEKLDQVFDKTQPDIVFHLAAQAFVSNSYENPFETYNTNVLGTLNVLEAARKNANVKALLLITTDKVYENNEWLWGYRENDRLGGFDPYSASKACCEILIKSHVDSFFNLEEYGKSHKTLIASSRAGNVIGGGDWGKDRLIPDIVKNCKNNKKTFIRRPEAVRPWQHVLESLSGYLILGQKLLEGEKNVSGAWNFGPTLEQDISVENLAVLAKKHWSEIELELNQSEKKPFHETSLLKLDSTKANVLLKWESIWSGEYAIQKSIEWYKEYYNNNRLLTEKQLNDYIEDAIEKNANWTK